MVIVYATVLQAEVHCLSLDYPGQVIFPSHHLRSFVRERCLITLRTLIAALKEASVKQIVLYAYGMKSLDLPGSVRR